MIENIILTREVANIVPFLSLEEIEEGCKAFIDDIEDGGVDEDMEWLFPILIDKKLEFYEKEY